MATSIYVYEPIELYAKLYAENRDDPMRECELLDLYLNDGRLYVLTNTSMHKEQPQLQRSIVHFRNGEIGEWEDGKEELVKYDDVRLNIKKDQIEFFPRFLRKPKLSMRIGRFYGNLEKGKIKVDYKNRFYDLHRDRITFILEDKNGS